MAPNDVTTVIKIIWSNTLLLSLLLSCCVKSWVTFIRVQSSWKGWESDRALNNCRNDEGFLMRVFPDAHGQVMHMKMRYKFTRRWWSHPSVTGALAVFYWFFKTLRKECTWCCAYWNTAYTRLLAQAARRLMQKCVLRKESRFPTWGFFWYSPRRRQMSGN